MDSHISFSSDELNPRSRNALASANIVRPASSLRVSDGLRFFGFVTRGILFPKSGLGDSAALFASGGRGRERLWGDSDYDLNRTCSWFSWVACKSIPDSLQEDRRFLCGSIEDRCVGGWVRYRDVDSQNSWFKLAVFSELNAIKQLLGRHETSHFRI
jgi:hypothetical protein